MSEFKKGDKVRCIRKDLYGFLKEGRVYEIESMAGTSPVVDGELWHPSRFEPIEKEEPAWIDAREREPEDGQLIAIKTTAEAFSDYFSGVYLAEIDSVTNHDETISWFYADYWLPLPDPPEPEDERLAAIEEFFEGDWERQGRNTLYDSGRFQIAFGKIQTHFTFKDEGVEVYVRVDTEDDPKETIDALYAAINRSTASIRRKTR